MNIDTFNKEHDILITKSMDIMRSKNKDYSVNDDPLAGFNKIAKDLGITSFQVWAVFASKHWQALTNFASKGTIESEPIEGRIIDMINYSCLLHLLIIDDKSWITTQSEEFIKDKLRVYPISEKDSIYYNLSDEEMEALAKVKSMTNITPKRLKIYFNI